MKDGARPARPGVTRARADARRAEANRARETLDVGGRQSCCEGLPTLGREHIENDMKRMLVEIDDRSARDLERVAPTRERKRAEFIRLAIRAAIDRALDRATRDAYRRVPQSGELVEGDVEGWDERNTLAVHARPQAKARRRRRRGARVA